MIKQRLKKLQKDVKSANLDAVIISSTSNIFYFTGFSYFSPLEREAFLLVTRNDAFLLTDPRYQEAVKDFSKNGKLLIHSSEIPFKKQLEILKQQQNIKILGIEDNNLTVSEFNFFKKLFKIHSANFLLSVREVKDSQEILAIQKACAITDITFSKILAYIKPGLTEKELAFFIDTKIREQDADPSFPTIVCFGKNTSDIHHTPSNTVLKQKDMVLIDMGARYNGYCSDMSRTFFIGKATTRQEKMYQTVLEAQEKAIEAIQNNIEANKIDKVARDYIIQQGFPAIPHSLGHGTGIDVHELPFLSSGSKEKLKTDMVFSIEPGIYISEQEGIRIEDLVTIKNNKPTILCTSAKTLIEL